MISESSLLVAINSFTVMCSAWLAYLGLDKEAILLFSLLLLIDYVTGVTKSYKLGYAITSVRMKYGILSKLSLLLIPIVLAIGAKAVGSDFKSVLIIGLNILILSEVYSIIGNIYSIRTHKELPEYDVVAMLGNKIRNMLLKLGDDTK